VSTAKARTNIRHYLKDLRNDDAVVLGRRLLNKYLHAFSTTLVDVDHARIDQLVAEYEMEDFEEILGDIGLGNRSVMTIAQKLTHDVSSTESTSIPLMIAGTEGMVVSFGRCCHPIPGDPIHGFVSSGRGIIVHQANCKNTVKLRAKNDKWLDVAWAKDINRDFPVDIIVRTKNQRGALATIAAVVSEMDSNIDNVLVDERDSGYSDLRLTIEVTGRQHLARIIRRLRHLDMVERITRVN